MEGPVGGSMGCLVQLELAGDLRVFVEAVSKLLAPPPEAVYTLTLRKCVRFVILRYII